MFWNNGEVKVSLLCDTDQMARRYIISVHTALFFLGMEGDIFLGMIIKKISRFSFIIFHGNINMWSVDNTHKRKPGFITILADVLTWQLIVAAWPLAMLGHQQVQGWLHKVRCTDLSVRRYHLKCLFYLVGYCHNSIQTEMFQIRG